MRCPFCGHDETQVKDSRPTEDGSAIRRRRFCPACGSRSSVDHELAMQRLQGAGAVIVSPEMVAFEWLQDCRHASFKPVLQMFKTRID